MAAVPSFSNFGLGSLGIGTGTALLGSGLISGLGSIVGGGKQAQAASEAAQAQVQAAQIAAQTQLEMFGVAQNALNPFIQYGQNAMPTVQQMTGTAPGTSPLTAPLTSPLQTNWPMFSPTPSQLAATPGYQFQQQVTQNQIGAQQAAQGRGYSGGALFAEQAAGTGLAQSTWQAQLQSYLAQVQQQQQGTSLALNQRAQTYNMLTGQVNTGVGAAGALAGTAVNTGQGIAETQLASGQAQAGGIIGSANAMTNAIGGVTGAASNTALLYAMNQGGLFGNPTG